jgi:hypothetical protein
MHARLENVLDDTRITVGDDRLLVPGRDAFPNGSQGLVCRPGVARILAAELRERMSRETADERRAWAMDVGLWRCCVELLMARLLYAHPCLLWHQDGVPSTWADKDPRWEGNDAAHRMVRRTIHFRPW